METFTFIALILLSLAGYSAGAVTKAGKLVELKPIIIDLMLVVLIWIGAVYSRVEFDLDKWFAILVWIVLAYLVGFMSVWPRKLAQEKPSSRAVTDKNPTNIFQKFWHRWIGFSKRMGGFQSRIILSFFFLVIVMPFAVGVKIFSDPLGIKAKPGQSHWLSVEEIKLDIESFRRQF